MSRKNQLNRGGGLRRSPRLNILLKGAKIPRRSARILNMKSLSNFRTRKRIQDLQNTRNSNMSVIQAENLEASKSTDRDWRRSNDEPSKLDGLIAMTKTRFCSYMEFSANGCREDAKCTTASDLPENFIRKSEELNGGRYSLIKAKKRYRWEGEGKKVQYCINGSATVDGWTKDQELALQNAYFWARPSPHFWKRVSKLVGGKSEQECFDKIQSDCLTPVQRPGRSRLKRSDISFKPIPVGDLLKSSGEKCGRFSKNKCLVRCKTVRELMKKHYIENKNDEGDMFSILEDDTRGEENQTPLSGITGLQVDTSVKTEAKKTDKNEERESLSLRSSPGMVVVMESDGLGSPEVLKEMKDWGRHERYVTQLQSREATRMAAHNIMKVTSSHPVGFCEFHERADAVKAARNSLVFTAQDAMQLFHTKQATYSYHQDSDSSEVDVE